jgi:hypothetical protein
MEQRQTAARQAAFLLALALFVHSKPTASMAPRPCDHPVRVSTGSARCAHRPQARLEGPLRRVFGLRLDPNRAGVMALETLPGIGPARANAIVRERCRRPFSALHDLDRVHGLGPARLRAVEPFLAFEQPLAPPAGSSVESACCRFSCENGEIPTGDADGVARERATEAAE